MIKGISDALFAIFVQGKYADKEVPLILKSNPRWGSRDRRFVAGQVYDLVRWYGYYKAFIEPGDTTDFFTRLLGVKLILEGHDLSQIPAFAGIDANTILSKRDAVLSHRYLRLAVPEWLDKRGSDELGPKWESEMTALNERAAVVIRVNLSRISRDEVLSHFTKNGIQAGPVDGLPAAIVIGSRVNFEKDPYYMAGYFEIQDAGSQQIALFTGAQPGDFIIDACAGAGGKTLHLADLTGAQANILAMDAEVWKLKNLQYRAQKSHFGSIDTQPISLDDIPSDLNRKADVLLLDVPCSGLGVLKRVPDTKWKLDNDALEDIRCLQLEILNTYSAFVKPGGTLVYATCSILPSENDVQVNSFLKQRDNFELIAQHHQWPSLGFDGFYMARLRRIG